MGGQWLNRIPGWSVAQGDGNRATGGRRRYVLRAPNGRRWQQVASDGNALLEACGKMHKLGLCAKGEPLDAPITTEHLPSDAREIPQRKCRSCSRVRKVEFFIHVEGRAESCRSCVIKRCQAGPGERSIPKSSLVPCPVCAEPGPGQHLAEVAGLGLACRGCADVAAVAAALVDVPIVLPTIELAAERPYLRLVHPIPVPPRQLQIAGTEVYRLPQASDLGKLRALLECVGEGMRHAQAIGVRMGAKAKGAARHASYYRQAAEILGLLESGRWRLTALGKRVIAAQGIEELGLLRSAIAGADDLGPLRDAILGNAAPDVEGLVEQMARLLPGLSLATVKQRVRATLRWRETLRSNSVERRDGAVLEFARATVARDRLPSGPPVRAEDFEHLMPACFAF